jgi:SAM-dependent methyltransferase
MNEAPSYLANAERGPGGPGGRLTRALSLARLVDLRRMRVLDVGCGEGWNAFDLAECGCAEVVGVEYRERFVRTAETERLRLGLANVRFVQGDARRVDEMGLGRFGICLCAGLLYHMQNPFNLLKRLRNVCRTLALETHVAPPLLRQWWTAEKYRRNLHAWPSAPRLDGVRFYGRINEFPPTQDMDATSGSVASRCTLWLSRGSLRKALKLAGFRIRVMYWGRTPGGWPDIAVAHGNHHSKVFVLAETLDPGRVIPVSPGRIARCDCLAASVGQDRQPPSP